MLTKDDLETLAQTRLEDSIFLLQAGRSSSAYYLAGYAVELAIKAYIAKSFQPNTIPDKAFVLEIYQHSLEKLLSIAGLLPAFTLDSSANPSLAASWGIASKWTETSRYLLWDAISAASLVSAIGDPRNGVFQWVKKHW
jgi:hypothetical protein